MSAILSADDLNDFINPGVACIKPVETLPKQQPTDPSNPYEVTTEEKAHAANPPPAQISLTDCLACSGCVTSAEAVLVSLQSHNEVLDTLDRYAMLDPSDHTKGSFDGQGLIGSADIQRKVFVASVSPQTRASLAATYNVSEREAGHMIQQLLTGPLGLRSSGIHGSYFTWVVDTNVMRKVCLEVAAEEVQTVLDSSAQTPKRPILTSACPGWICYAEKTHPHILPHLSKLKSPQALTGTLIKSVLARKFGISPAQVWHMAVMPCFDKKLEASRSELTSHTWHRQDGDAVRDVDCVITARELLMLAESRNISFPCLPRKPVSRSFAIPFPDATIDAFVFGGRKRRWREHKEDEVANAGTSGGYLWHILQAQKQSRHGSSIHVQRGRNADVSDYSVVDVEGVVIFKAARYYGFRNIQNLVRRLKPAKASRMPGAHRRPGATRSLTNGSAAHESEYAYVEVMACPGGCTNGGGQIKVGDVATLRQIGVTDVEHGSMNQEVSPLQREWLAKVDEAYWSAENSEEVYDESIDDKSDFEMGGLEAAKGQLSSRSSDCSTDADRKEVRSFLEKWAAITGIDADKLVYTTYREVESDVGKEKKGSSRELERVSALAVAQGGGW